MHLKKCNQWLRREMLNNHQLETYLDKLAIKRSKELSLDLVEKIQTAHIGKFTFNNIDVLLNRPISIKSNDIFKKMVIENRGGYCFEHNGLMYDVLKALGFNVRIILARVIMNEEVDSERGHRVTLLTLNEKEYIVDVGFTAESQSYPIEIGKNTVTKEHRVIKEDDTYRFQMYKEDKAFTFYTYTLEHYTQSDCKVSNFYSYAHDEAVFRNVFALSRITPSVTYSLRNNEYHKICKEKTTIKELSSLEEFSAVLKKDFNLDIDAGTSKIIFDKSIEFRKKQ